ncbi:hypothetical protein C8R46DRAFT_1076861 [Mycena filopes]|nr:hypothetical protein C8R46DRAFT_1076861 [Mycena filopes]
MARLLAATLLFLALTSFTAGAAVRETNGERMAKGLPPLPPRWMPTRTRTGSTAPSPSPSSAKSTNLCRPGDTPLCCHSAVPANDTTATFLLNLLGAPLQSRTDLGLVAITCSSLRNPGCSHQVVCCSHDEFDGVIATGCVL